MKRCVIVQGPTYGNCLPNIRYAFMNYDVIWSTWRGYESWYGDDDIVLFTHLPHDSGTKNLNYQKESTLEGLRLAKKLGYDRALKWRSDMWVNNADGLFRTFDDGYNTFCWVDSNGGYLTDYWMEDSVDNLIQLWDVHPYGEFPEKVITNRIKELGWMDRVNVVINKLNSDNDIFWNTKHGEPYWMSVCKEIDLYNKKINNG